MKQFGNKTLNKKFQVSIAQPWEVLSFFFFSSTPFGVGCYFWILPLDFSTGFYCLRVDWALRYVSYLDPHKSRLGKGKHQRKGRKD